MQKKLEIPLLFITHNLEEAFLLADRILVLHKGKVQQLGTLEDIFYNPKNRKVAELIGLLNIFDDARVEGYDKASRSTVLKSVDLRIRVNSLNINKGTKKKITVKLARHNKILTAEVPSQFADVLQLNTGDLCLVKMEISKVVTF
ncbi:hypothetical protein [Methanosarcina baikalica]|uniref:hypothetical protein n=1 Tax=Methanosarcina baikalica TaxID=3073890 RepID=UPI0037C96EDB